MAFRDIIGHAELIAVLQRTLTLNKLAHAYIFEGIEGCGKHKTALALINELFCVTRNSCGECPACRKLITLQHPDLHLIEPDGAFIKIEQVRQLQKELSYRPFEAERKTCIIDQADRLNQSAGNALLKTLEEPPGNALIILVTAKPGSMMPTIVSRCQALRFPALPQNIVEDFLLGQGHPHEAASIAAALAGGSLKKALDICTETTLSERASLLRQIDALRMDDISPLLQLAERVAADKDNIVELLDLLTTYLRDILLLHGGSQDLTNQDLVELIEVRAVRSSPTGILAAIDHVTAARQALARNVNPRLTLEVLFMRLAST